MPKKTYKINGMTCDSCAKMIELDLEDHGHICKCSYAKETLEIETEHKIEELMKLIKRAGYTLIHDK